MKFVKGDDYIFVEYNDDLSVKEVWAYPDSTLVRETPSSWTRCGNSVYMATDNATTVLIDAVNKGYKAEPKC